jgi:hypothetical protein
MTPSPQYLESRKYRNHYHSFHMLHHTCSSHVPAEVPPELHPRTNLPTEHRILSENLLQIRIFDYYKLKCELKKHRFCYEKSLQV